MHVRDSSAPGTMTSSNHTAAPVAPSLEPVDVLRYARAMRDKWWVFVLLFALVGGNVFYYLSQRTPIYRASSEVKILRTPETFTRFSPLVDDTLRTPEDLNTLIGVYQSPLFVKRVAERIRQEDSTAFLAPYWNPADGTPEPDIERILFDNRSITPGRLTLIMTVSYDHPRPDVAAAVTNFFIDEITAYETETQADIARRALRELRAQAETHRRRIENLETQLVDFKEEHGTISFDRRSDIDAQELLFLTTSLSQDQRLLDVAENSAEVLDRVLAEGRPAWEIQAIADNPRVSQLLMAIGQRRAELDRLATRYRDRHPRMIEAGRAIEATQRELDQVVEAQVNTIRNEHQLALANVRDSERKLEEKKQSIISLQRLQANYDSMLRDLDTTRQMYLYLFQRLQETESQSRNDGVNAQVLYRAVPPLFPFRPNTTMSVGLAVAAGGTVGFLVVLLLVVVDHKVKTQRDVERDLGQTILTTIERMPGRDRLPVRLAGRALQLPSTCETLSSLAISLRLGAPHPGNRVILVTSTLAGEGKSFLAAGLAAAFARLGDRTVLISADLRGTAHQQLPEGTRPLEEINAMLDDDWSPFIGREPHTGVDIVAAGASRYENPYAVFNGPRFAALMQHLRGRYERIVIDTPPLAHFGDTLALAPFADVAVFTLRFNKVPLRLARRALASIHEAGIPIAGTVVNAVRTFEIKMYFPAYYRRSTGYRPRRKDRTPPPPRKVETALTP